MEHPHHEHSSHEDAAPCVDPSADHAHEETWPDGDREACEENPNPAA